MSLDKAITSGKEHRRQYRKSEAFDASCRPHGGGHRYACPWCEGRRLNQKSFKDKMTKEEVKEASSGFGIDTS